ncbi:MAG: hypothetical protein IJH12_06175 [Clostridia bacterium]|nr:hypothetical protein [Clostridia bacterium]
MRKCLNTKKYIVCIFNKKYFDCTYTLFSEYLAERENIKVSVNAALHAAIDDATGNIVGMYFDEQETLNGYYQITHQILTTYGITNKIKTDKGILSQFG